MRSRRPKTTTNWPQNLNGLDQKGRLTHQKQDRIPLTEKTQQTFP